MNLTQELDALGFALCRGALAADELQALLTSIESSSGAVVARQRTSGSLRNVLWSAASLAPLLAQLRVGAIASTVLGAEAFPINAIYFDKTADANWKVPGHQDLMVPVDRRADEPEFSGWGEKLGVVHVEPPAEVLARLVALRIHFDECPSSNGALAVVPGSHKRGKLNDAELTAIPFDRFTVCEAAAGDVLAMSPLIVHRSSPATLPGHRRVLHVVYASSEPGQTVRWKRG